MPKKQKSDSQNLGFKKNKTSDLIGANKDMAPKNWDSRSSKIWIQENYDLLHFEDVFPDGRLVDNPKDASKNFRFREALKLFKELGRPLTKEEMQQFERNDDEQ